jgi:hypothetical protein
MDDLAPGRVLRADAAVRVRSQPQASSARDNSMTNRASAGVAVRMRRPFFSLL